MLKKTPPSARYQRIPAPSSVGLPWRLLVICIFALLALASGAYLGSVVFNAMKQIYPAPELTWPDKRAIKPARMGKREFAQYVDLERRYVEDSMRQLLPTSVSVYSIWKTCGDSDCARPSLENLMALSNSVANKKTFVQRVCGLSTRFLGSNIAGVVWDYDEVGKRCVASNWQEIQASVKRANQQASLVGALVGLFSAALLFAIGYAVMRLIVNRIDASQQDIGIE